MEYQFLNRQVNTILDLPFTSAGMSLSTEQGLPIPSRSTHPSSYPGSLNRWLGYMSRLSKQAISRFIGARLCVCVRAKERNVALALLPINARVQSLLWRYFYSSEMEPSGQF
jgi:hypothetical protein